MHMSTSIRPSGRAESRMMSAVTSVYSFEDRFGQLIQMEPSSRSLPQVFFNRASSCRRRVAKRWTRWVHLVRRGERFQQRLVIGRRVDGEQAHVGQNSQLLRQGRARMSVADRRVLPGRVGAGHFPQGNSQIDVEHLRDAQQLRAFDCALAVLVLPHEIVIHVEHARQLDLIQPHFLPRFDQDGSHPIGVRGVVLQRRSALRATLTSAHYPAVKLQSQNGISGSSATACATALCSEAPTGSTIMLRARTGREC